MKVLFVLPFYSLPVPATKGGAIETLLTILLRENEKTGKFEFVFISPDNNRKIINYKHSVVYIIENENNHYEYDYAAARIAKKEKPDYIIMEGYALRLDGCFREVIGADNLAIHLHSEFERKGVFSDSFGVTIATSNYIAQKWNANAKDNKDNTFILTNSINTDLFSKEITAYEYEKCRTEMGFASSDFVVIYCGRIVDVKGVRELIEAVSGIEDSEIKLLIIGTDSFANGNNGLYANEITNRIEQLKGKVSYVGYIQNDELYKWYKSSNLQVIPSLCDEAFGLVAIEGMASGLPIIYTDSGALPELIGVAGEMIIRDDEIVNQIREKILWLKNNQWKLKELASEGKNKSKLYSSTLYYENFCSLMEWWKKKK